MKGQEVENKIGKGGMLSIVSEQEESEEESEEESNESNESTPANLDKSLGKIKLTAIKTKAGS